MGQGWDGETRCENAADRRKNVADNFAFFAAVYPAASPLFSPVFWGRKAQPFKILTGFEAENRKNSGAGGALEPRRAGGPRRKPRISRHALQPRKRRMPLRSSALRPSSAMQPLREIHLNFT
jgi:hypothetical protein